METKPRKQAIAIGLDVQRRAKRQGLAAGGPATADENIVPHPVIGHLDHDGPGRTDDLPIAVPEGAYVIPADIVSALGQGNTTAGVAKLDQKFGANKPSGFAMGGAPSAPVDIVAAGGEYIVPPEQVQRVGNGDIQRGHDILDAFVKRVREQTVKTLSALPGPKK